jgi:hypothetical protein
MPTPPLTDEQCIEAALAVKRNHGSVKRAAEQMGMNYLALRYRLKTAARRGFYGTNPVMPGFEIARVSTTEDADGTVKSRSIVQKPERDVVQFSVPQGHRVKGVSALVDADGAIVQQWMKTTEGELDPVWLANQIKDIFEGLSPANVVPAPVHVNDDLITIYPIADAHIGMRAWERDAGESYDVDIAVARLRDWIGRLVASSPASKEAIILDVGDTMHMDNGSNQTPASKHVLDVDGRYFRTLEMTIAALADAVELALAKHETVRVVIIAGNHNPHSFMAVLFALSERYRKNPRVTVRKDPREFWATSFGDCLLSAHHGDKARPERLVMFLADEYAEEWGKTKHRFLWTGHLHHHRSADIGGVKWEQLRAMTARDSYAYTHAYSGRAQLQAITLHRRAGEIQRQAVSACFDG